MITFIVLGCCVSFLIGYILGKHHGWKIGYLEAESIVPLDIRQQSLEQGRCIICDECWVKTANFENSSRNSDTL